MVLPWDGRDHYLAGIYRTSLADRADALVAAGERSMRALVDTVDTQRIVMPEQPSLTNVNTAADLTAVVAARELASKFADIEPSKCDNRLISRNFVEKLFYGTLAARQPRISAGCSRRHYARGRPEIPYGSRVCGEVLRLGSLTFGAVFNRSRPSFSFVTARPTWPASGHGARRTCGAVRATRRPIRTRTA